MQFLFSRAFGLFFVTFLLVQSHAASVGPSGYTNDFSVRPAAADFSTSGGISGGSGDVITADGLDSVVQTVAASSLNVQTTDASANNPPAKLAAAMWTSAGGAYLVTRPTGNKASLLMATLLNNTGTNCNLLHFSYQLTVGASFSEEVPGQRLYYSFSGLANSWTPLAAVSGLNSSQLVNANVALSQNWNNGATLYLLWADDNAGDSTESAYEIDNFFASTYYTNFPLTITLTSPASGQHIGAGTFISAAVALTGSPTNVSYYLDGNLVTNRTTAPFSPVSLPAQTVGTHTLCATVRDASDTFLTTATNTFVVDLSLSGTVSVNTTLYAANSPYTISGNLTIASNATLTIEAGTTLYFVSGVNLTIANGGQIVAEGTAEAPIRFTRPTPTSSSWGNITVSGDGDSPETRFFYTYFEGNGSKCIQVTAGTIYLDHCSWGTLRQFVSVDDASFIISDCYFPQSAGSGFEPLHGTGGIKAGGHGIVRNCFFGLISGYNDQIDFTGSNRPDPIFQVYNNVFMGSGDDCLDLDSTDAWVEGNIFLHVHKNGPPDTSSAVSGGNDTGNDGDVTVIGNIIYDVDQAANCKQGNFYTLLNNTIVHQTHQGGLDTTGAVVCTQDNGMTEALGYYLEGNIIVDVEALVRDQVAAVVTFTNNLMPLIWTGPGGNNSTNAPIFEHIPALSETQFTNWADAQIMKQWFRLQPGSPGIGTGPNGRDMGAINPMGASISGEPNGTTTATTATLRVGINRTGNSIPTDDFPNGSGFTHYRWRLDTNVTWSAETPINTPITLANLSDGSHYVEVIGKNDGDIYQNDPLLGANTTVTRSRTWTVENGVRISDVAFSGGRFDFQFPVTAGVTYTVQYKNLLGDPTWLTLTNVAAQTISGNASITDLNPPAQSRFYRVVSPGQ